MDFDKPKVYGDTFISDGLVFTLSPALFEQGILGEIFGKGVVEIFLGVALKTLSGYLNYPLPLDAGSSQHQPFSHSGPDILEHIIISQKTTSHSEFHPITVVWLLLAVFGWMEPFADNDSISILGNPLGLKFE